MSHTSPHKFTPDDQTSTQGSFSRRRLLRGAATGIAVAASSKIFLAQNPKTMPPGAPAIGAEPNRAIAQTMPLLQDEAPLPPAQRVGFAIVGLG